MWWRCFSRTSRIRFRSMTCATHSFITGGVLSWIRGATPPSRNGLSHANATRPVEFIENFFCKPVCRRSFCCAPPTRATRVTRPLPSPRSRPAKWGCLTAPTCVSPRFFADKTRCVLGHAHKEKPALQSCENAKHQCGRKYSCRRGSRPRRPQKTRRTPGQNAPHPRPRRR